MLENLGPILSGLALLLTAAGGVRLARRGAAREQEERATAAEGRAKTAEAAVHRRTTLLREIENWLVREGLLREPRRFRAGETIQFPPDLREDLEKETG